MHGAQVLNFLSSKTAASYMMRRNPRETAWTVLYRKKHKKGAEEEAKKRRTRRTVKFQRAVQGATLETILAKRNQKPEVRKAQREQQIRCGYGVHTHTHTHTHTQCAHSIASISVYLQQSVVKLLFSCRAAKEKAKHKEAQKAAKVRKEWLFGLVGQSLSCQRQLMLYI